MTDQVGDKNRDKLLNLLSLIFVFIAVAVIVISFLIFRFPFLPINPFPPPTLPAALILPSSTETLIPLPSTPVPEVSPTSIASPTKLSTSQPLSTSTTTNTPQPTRTSTLASGYRYKIQGEPAAISASIFNNDRKNCSWMGVAGQVHDMQDRPVTGILVLLGGTMEGNTVNQIMMSGTALNYGPAGYEFELADHPIASSGKLWIQLVDQAYIPLSAKVYFDTFADEACEKNLVIINFKQVR